MKNKKMFIILSIVALSASFAHATLEENFKEAVEQIKAKLTNDQEVNELVQAIAKQTASFQFPKDARYEERNALQKKWQSEVEQLTPFQQLATKIKNNLPEKALNSIKEIQKLKDINNEARTEQLALINAPKYKQIDVLTKELDDNLKALRKKEKYQKLQNVRISDAFAGLDLSKNLIKALDRKQQISPEGTKILWKAMQNALGAHSVMPFSTLQED